MNKIEIQIIIGILQSALSLIGHLDPDLAKNKVFVDINEAMNLLQSLGN